MDINNYSNYQESKHYIKKRPTNSNAIIFYSVETMFPQ